jgi:hypothetical protein
MVSPYTQKLLKIPVIVKNGELVLAIDQKPLPKFSEGASFEILIDPTAIPDKSRLIENEDEEAVQFLPKGTKLLAQVNADNVPKELNDFLHKSPRRIENYALVEIILIGDLHLRLRTGREATLVDVSCSSPFLQGREDPPAAVSINHAYTLISKYFEPHRRANTGNVFDKVFYQRSKDGNWLSLRTLRDEIQQARKMTDDKSSKQSGLF